MKAKNFMLLFFFIALWGNVTSFANEELCFIVNQPLEEAPPLPWDYAQLPNWTPTEWDTIDLAIHVITGTGEPGIDPNVLNAAIAQINPAFDDAMLYFQVFTTEYHFDDDFVYVFEFEAPLMFNSYRITGALNIYFVPGAGDRGMAEAIPSTSCLVQNEYADSSTLVHEIGHCLGLYHTHEIMFGVEDHPVNINCDEAGDVLCHTQADPGLRKVGEDDYEVDENCEYTGGGTYFPPTHNYMSYSRNICRNQFTVDQTWAMRYSLDTESALAPLDNVPFQFTNVFQEENIENSTLTLSIGGTINSGVYRAFNDGGIYDVTTDEEKFENYYNGKDIKHHHWNEDFPEFRLTHEFTARKSDLTNRNQLAKFEILDNSTFQMTLLHGGSNPDIAIKDPWYVINNSQPDIFHTFPVGGGGLDYQVFLNQPYTGNNPVFYSVQAPTQGVTVNGKTITYDWESWSYNSSEIDLQSSGSNPTAVVFKQPTAMLTANLKGRRTSDTPEATVGNNGRKISYHWRNSSQTGVFLIYQDRGNIYRAQQEGEGAPVWGKDSRIAAANANLSNSHPALAYLYEISGTPANQRAIAWQEYNLSEDDYAVRCNLAAFPLTGYENPHPPHPSVAGYRLFNTGSESTLNTAAISFVGGFEDEASIYDGIRIWFTRDGEVVPVNTESSADYPAIDNREYQHSVNWKEPWYMLAWQENAGIKYQEIRRQNDSGSQLYLTPATPTLLNSGYTDLAGNQFPSVHTAGIVERGKERVYVAWQATEQGGAETKMLATPPGESLLCPPVSMNTPVICFREKLGGWQALHIFSTGSTCDRLPVVTGWESGGNRDVAIAYRYGENAVRYLLRQNGAWSSATTLTSDGANPALTTINNVPHIIWSEYNASPYRVQHSQVSLIPDETIAGPEQEGPPHSRRIYFKLRESLVGGQQLPIDGDITFEIGDPQWLTAGGVQPVKPLYRDSLITPENAFRFNPITVSQAGERLVIPVKIVGRDLKRVSPTNNPFPLFPCCACA